jgi:outer membrane receptor for ferrienterochelin and colicins
MRNLTTFVQRALRLALLSGVTLMGCAAPNLAVAQAAPDPSASASKPIETIIVTGQPNRNLPPGALKDSIVRTEVFGPAAIEAVHANNINEALDRNPGIAVQVECSICNVRNVSLNSLPGRFTTLMIDGVPLFSSMSSAYGLDSVNVRGVQAIEVARGAGASLVAPEALSGTVNIVTRRPSGTELEASFDAGTLGTSNVGLYGGQAWGKFAASAALTWAKSDSQDRDGNGISEFTGANRWIAGVALFANFSDTTKGKLRVDYVHEDRGGGALGDDYAAIQANETGNPFDFRRGVGGAPFANRWLAPDGSGPVIYNQGRGGFSEIIFTRRTQALGTLEGQFSSNWRWRLAAGYAANTQDSYYELSTYDAKGNQSYGEAKTAYTFTNGMELTAGLNWRAEDLSSKGTTADGTPNNGIDDYVYETPGIFIQGYLPLLDDRLEINGSVRYDDHNVFGPIVSPRVNALFRMTDAINVRFSAGRGFRAPTSFFEQDHGILDTTRIVRDIEDPETSDNISFALNHAGDAVTWTATYNWTRIENYALLDPDAVDDSGASVTLFTSSPDPVTVQSLDVVGSWQATPWLSLSLGGEKAWFEATPGTLSFSRPDWTLYASGDIDIDKWDIFTRASVVGPHDVATFYDFANTPRFNFDGTLKANKTDTYTLVDLRVAYAMTDNISFFAGADNATDFHQADKDSPLWIDSEGGVDVTHIWGPMRGRYLYAGIKVSY